MSNKKKIDLDNFFKWNQVNLLILLLYYIYYRTNSNSKRHSFDDNKYSSMIVYLPSVILSRTLHCTYANVNGHIKIKNVRLNLTQTIKR